jgi:hypothetical protein
MQVQGGASRFAARGWVGGPNTKPGVMPWLILRSSKTNINNPLLATLPKLPDLITFIDLRNTSATKKPEVIERLEGFKAKHLPTICK